MLNIVARSSLLALSVFALSAAASAADSRKSASGYQEDDAVYASGAFSGAGTAVVADCGQGECEACGDICSSERLWTATADALFLHRSATRGPQLLSDPQSGNSLLDSSGLGFDYEAGPRLSLIRHGCALDFELNYFGIDGWRADAEFPNSAFPSGVGSLALDSAIPFPVTAASFEYTSRLYSAEFNVRRSINDWLTGLAGFRWMELEDNYLAQGTGAILSTPFSESIRSHNHLFGFQIGADATLLGRQDRFQIRGIGKAGIFGNAVGQNTNFSDPSGLGTLSADASGSHAGFVGEIGLIGSYQLTKHLTIRGGYQVMWIEGVALAPRQIPNTDLAGGTANIEGAGGLFCHGANAGLEMRW